MNLLKLLDRPIAFHRCLAEITGSANAGLLLSQAVYWQNRCPREDGWWWKAQPEWHEETFLTRQEFRTARTACVHFLEWKVVGMPAVTHYRVRIDRIEAVLACQPSSQPESTIQPAGINQTIGLNQPSTVSEITPETPSETTNPLPPSVESSQEEPKPPKIPTTRIEAWNEFKDHCAQSRRPLTDPAEREQWAILKALPEPEAIKICREAIVAGQVTIKWAIEKQQTRAPAGNSNPDGKLTPAQWMMRKDKLGQLEDRLDILQREVGFYPERRPELNKVRGEVEALKKAIAASAL